MIDWAEFFHMGGYAFYVWTSWGLTALVLLWQFIQPKRASARIKRELKRQLSREQKSRENNANSQN